MYPEYPGFETMNMHIQRLRINNDKGIPQTLRRPHPHKYPQTSGTCSQPMLCISHP